MIVPLRRWMPIKILNPTARSAIISFLRPESRAAEAMPSSAALTPRGRQRTAELATRDRHSSRPREAACQSGAAFIIRNIAGPPVFMKRHTIRAANNRNTMFSAVA